MKRIKQVTIYDRLYLAPIIKSLKGSSGDIFSGVKLLEKLSINEEEMKDINLRADGNELHWDPVDPKDLLLEDSHYIFLMKVFEQRDKEEAWEMDVNVAEMIKRFKGAEDE
jgi:hypothetical protein